MNHSDAFRFFEAHPIMQNDEVLSEDRLKTFNEIRELLKVSPNDELLKLYFMSFGKGSGYGVYQLSDDALKSHSGIAIESALWAGMESGNPGAVYWCLHFFGEFPGEWQRPYIYKYISDKNDDMRHLAAMGMLYINRCELDYDVIDSQLAKEKDEDIQITLRECRAGK